MGCNQEHRLEIVAREQVILNWLLSSPFLGALVVWDLCRLQIFKTSLTAGKTPRCKMLIILNQQL